MCIHARFLLERSEFILDVDLEIPGRDVTALFGRSGSGKTTLLRCLAGLERIRRGRLTFNGQTWQDGHRWLPVHQRPLGYVFQEDSLFPHLKVRDNLLYGFKRVPTEQRHLSLDEVTCLLGLTGLLGRYPDELSGGQRKRASIGRALLTSPKLLLMDEPMASLDAASKSEILPYLERLRDELAIPIVYVSHSIDEVARLADHMVLLDNGQALAQGPLQSLLTRTDLPLAHSQQASSVIEAHVIAHHHHDSLTELAFSGGNLLIARQQRDCGATLRVRILARDVTVALTRPIDSSALNTLQARVIEISDDPQPSHIILSLAVGEQVLLARISLRSYRELQLAPGTEVWAMVKVVAIT